MRTASLKNGKNPIVAVYDPGAGRWAVALSKTISYKKVKPTPVTLKVSAAIDIKTSQGVLTARATSKIKGHRVANRSVVVLVNGKTVGATKTDSRGVAVFRLDSSMVSKGENPIIVRYKPGTTKYRAVHGKTLVLRADSAGRVVEVVK